MLNSATSHTVHVFVRYQPYRAWIKSISLAEIISHIRRQSRGFSRGHSKFRGVTQHPNGTLLLVLSVHWQDGTFSWRFSIHSKAETLVGVTRSLGSPNRGRYKTPCVFGALWQSRIRSSALRRGSGASQGWICCYKLSPWELFNAAWREPINVLPSECHPFVGYLRVTDSSRPTHLSQKMLKLSCMCLPRQPFLKDGRSTEESKKAAMKWIKYGSRQARIPRGTSFCEEWELLIDLWEAQVHEGINNLDQPIGKYLPKRNRP